MFKQEIPLCLWKFFFREPLRHPCSVTHKGGFTPCIVKSAIWKRKTPSAPCAITPGLCPARAEDFCLLTEQGTLGRSILWRPAASGAIPCYDKPTLGAGLAMKVGPMLERYKLYVPYAYLEKARETVEPFLGDPSQDAVHLTEAF